jgi:ribosomal protein L11 methyltransferase
VTGLQAFRISFPPQEEDAVTALLSDLGTAGAEGGAGGSGPAGEMLAYFPARDGLEAALSRGLAPLGGRATAVPIPDVDWVARFREGFRTFRVGPFLVAPAWDPPEPAPHVLVVDPGLAFGTGTHETTRLCLLALSARAATAPLGDVADVGTGSALLAVAAARLGARRVVGIDLDADALPCARRHVEINGVPVHLVRGDGGRALRERSCDVVTANLTTAILVERAAELAARVRLGGTLILSGLLAADVPAVERAFSGHGPRVAATEGEWASLSVTVA